MKKSEKILLVGTIGVGLVLVATSLPGKGRRGAAPAGPAVESRACGAAVAPAGPGTLELLARGKVALKPLVPGMRNPFRPIRAPSAEVGVQVAIKVTGIFGEEGEPAAFVKGELIAPGTGTAGLTVVRMADEKERLAVLLKGTLVRAGDTIAELKVVRVGRRGVWLEHRGQRFFVQLYKRLDRSDEPEKGSRPAGAGETESTTH